MNAAYLIPALPLAGFLVLVVFGRRLGNPLAGWLATVAIAGSFLASVVTFVALLGRSEEQRAVTKQVFTWLPVGRLHVNVALLLDPLSITMALFVTGIGTLIHLYSVGYMSHDERYSKFFVYLNLFAFSMLVLVLADNYLLTFLGWEGVGACSYFLISFWFERETAAVAGKKAFVTNRVGDFGFMSAVFLIFAHTGSLTYHAVFAQAGSLGSTTTTWIALALFLGACGKSAQLPLYVWLPDAMEGPTPVSALIHAATMVTAGVFLMARSSPILHYAPGVLTLVAVVGAATALFAATIACAQDDIKKVLAYSTISQLGYMFLAVGSGAYVAGIFHMVTHAFFKALLFLGAGSVIHGMHDEQDMKRMGGLRKWMPVTAVTFIIGWLAIAGVPPFAGFWSKDDILAAAYHKSVYLWAVGAFTAGLTAYYMTRQVALVFFGTERWRDADHGADAEHQDAEHQDAEPHESPWTMALPLCVLAALSIFGGLLNIPFKKIDFLHRWLGSVITDKVAPEIHVASNIKWTLFAATTVLVALGIAAGFRFWGQRSENRQLEPAILKRAWGVDGLYAFLFGSVGGLVAAESAAIDKVVIDGAVNGAGNLVRSGGSRLRTLQTGFVRNYAVGIAAGVVLLLGWALVRTVA